MKAAIVSALIVVLGAMFGLQAAWLATRAESSNTALSADDALCGPRSLHIALNLLGQPIQPEDIIRRCSITLDGVSFGDLALAAKHFGVTADLRRLNWEELLAANQIAVLFVDGSHYLTVDTRGKERHDGRVRCYDPGHVARWVDRLQLERRWRGEALLLDTAGGRGHWPIMVEPYWQDCGFITADSQTFRVRVENRGTAPCNLKVVGTSCRCTTASLESEVLGPGESTNLVAEVVQKDRRGFFQERVQLMWDPGGVPVDVWLCGGKFADTLCRPREFLGELIPGQPWHKAVYIHDPGDDSLILTRQSCTLRLQTAESHQDLPFAVNVERVASTDDDVGVNGLHKVKAGDYRVTLSGTVPDGHKPERIDGALTISTSLPAPLDHAGIHLSGRILSELECDPPAILLDDTKANQGLQLRIQHRQNAVLQLRGYRVSREDLMVAKVEDITTDRSSSDRKGSLVLSISIGLMPARQTASPCRLTIQTSRGDIEVPILVSRPPVSTQM